jgi:hypothetical protein
VGASFLEKGEIAEGKRIPKLFSGTMQNMQRTVTFSGALSADKEFLCHGYARVHGFLHNVRGRILGQKKRERKKL